MISNKRCEVHGCCEASNSVEADSVSAVSCIWCCIIDHKNGPDCYGDTCSPQTAPSIDQLGTYTWQCQPKKWHVVLWSVKILLTCTGLSLRRYSHIPGPLCHNVSWAWNITFIVLDLKSLKTAPRQWSPLPFWKLSVNHQFRWLRHYWTWISTCIARGIVVELSKVVFIDLLWHKLQSVAPWASKTRCGH